MGRPARKLQIDLDRVGCYHLYSRCVRSLFLIGSGNDEPRDRQRKEWLETRQDLLASVYAIDILGYVVMDNHMHHVIIIRPDIAKMWSAEEVIRRWHVFHHVYGPRGQIVPMTPERFDKMVNDAKLVAELRRRLVDPSWLMKDLKEWIAKRCNAQDEVSGNFWNERFKSVGLLDFPALLVCLIYVDLNPVRAAMVRVPEDYEYSSIHRRVKGWGARRARAGVPADPAHPDADAALVPIPEDGEAGNKAAPRWRNSDRGGLPLKTEQYVVLLDWAGRQVRADKRGVIPSDVAPILERLNIAGECWEEAAAFYGSVHHAAVGGPEAMQQE